MIDFIDFALTLLLLLKLSVSASFCVLSRYVYSVQCAYVMIPRSQIICQMYNLYHL